MFFKIKVFFISLLTLIAIVSCSSRNKAVEECAEYAKFGIPSQEGEILCYEGEMIDYNQERKTPIWVIEHLTKEKVKKQGIKREGFNFEPDPNLERGKRAELEDYHDSGYDRVHMAPADDMEWSSKAMQQCFYLSNMIPQSINVNRGIWSHLEEKVRKWAMERGELYVYTGPIYLGKSWKTIGQNKVAVPNFIFKIVFDPQEMEACAFIIPNKTLEHHVIYRYLVSIREVEEKTHLNFLSELDSKTQDKIEKVKPEKMWQ